MSAIKTTAGQHQLETRNCPNCKAILPPQAQFCGSCGRRVGQKVDTSSPQVENDIKERYRITSLIRRRPYIQQFMATDIQYQRPVIIRDIDISGLNEEAQTVALKAVQEEYDQLRRQYVQDTMPLVDLRRIWGHIYTVAEWPFTQKQEEKHERPLYTLDDLLQSGIGLPAETEAVLWIERLARTISHLHSQQIILSDLDPYAIIVSSDTYEGIPTLMVSWLPQALRALLPQPPAKAYTSDFYAPETQEGDIRVQSDIYSLGAILYLLLTGTAPTKKTQTKKRVLRSPRELPSAVSSGVEAIVMRALAIDPLARFASAQEFANVLSDLITAPRVTQQPTHPLISTVFKGRRDALEPPAARPSKPALPHITKVLPAVPPVFPQTPQSASDAESAAVFDKNNAQDTADVDMVAIDEGDPPLAIEDVETIIIDASEFEAALAQATQHQLSPEEEELYTQLASEAPEAAPVDAEIHNQSETSSEAVVAAQQASDDVIAKEASSVQDEESQGAFALDGATVNIAVIEEYPTMVLEAEIEAYTEMEKSGEQEASIADIPTAALNGPASTTLEVAQERREELEPIAGEGSEHSRQPVSSSASEEENGSARQVAHHASIEEIEDIKIQGTPIEDTATPSWAEPAQPTVPDKIAADGDEAEQASASAASEPDAGQNSSLQAGPENDRNQDREEENPFGQQIKRFFTAPLPIIPRLLANRAPSDKAPGPEKTVLDQASANAEKLLKRLRHFILGQQQHSTSAAALIETPLRIQPNQNYTIRIQIIGRDAPRQRGVGLSGLIQSESVHIEVRSALYHKYAYIVQQADIRLPGHGFAAAVTIPMKPLSDGPSGRRERLHVYFMDEQRNPLYEKPFAVEIFISPLVQPGREGHNVLPIPL